MASLSESLRTALTNCGRSRYRVSIETGISQAALCRFAQGEPMRGPNLDRLAEALGLELRPKVGPKARRKAR